MGYLLWPAQPDLEYRLHYGPWDLLFLIFFAGLALGLSAKTMALFKEKPKSFFKSSQDTYSPRSNWASAFLMFSKAPGSLRISRLSAMALNSSAEIITAL